MNLEHAYLAENIEACEASIAASAAVLESMTECLTREDPDYPPVHIDIERMEKALAGPRWTIPNGLTHQQIIEFMNDRTPQAQTPREGC